MEQIYQIRGARILYCRDGDRRRWRHEDRSIRDKRIERNLFTKEFDLINQINNELIRAKEIGQYNQQENDRDTYWRAIRRHDFQPYWTEDEMEQYWHDQIENLQNRYKQLHDPYRKHRIQRLIIELAQQQQQQRTERK